MKKTNIKFWILQGCCLFTALVGIGLIISPFLPKTDNDWYLNDTVKVLNGGKMHGYIEHSVYPHITDDNDSIFYVYSRNIDIYNKEIYNAFGDMDGKLVVVNQHIFSDNEIYELK